MTSSKTSVIIETKILYVNGLNNHLIPHHSNKAYKAVVFMSLMPISTRRLHVTWPKSEFGMRTLLHRQTYAGLYITLLANVASVEHYLNL